MRLRASTAALLIAVLVPTVARAQGDGLYGRFDGDLVLSGALGGGLASSDGTAGLLTGELRARYMDTAGLWVAPSLRPAGGAATLGFGVELRPLFPALFLADLSHGDAFFDQLLQSLSLDLGLGILAPGGQTTAALVVGLGFDVPLVVERGEGLFVHVGAQHRSASRRDRSSQLHLSEYALVALIGFRGLVQVGIAGHEPPRYRR